MVYNGYYKVMSNIPKMGQLPTPVLTSYDSRHNPPRTFWLLYPISYAGPVSDELCWPNMAQPRGELAGCAPIIVVDKHAEDADSLWS